MGIFRHIADEISILILDRITRRLEWSQGCGSVIKAKIILFNPGYDFNGRGGAIEREYQRRRLWPVSKDVLKRLNMAEPSLSKIFPNATCVWSAGKGRKLSFVTFVHGTSRNRSKDDFIWEGEWWFAGVSQWQP